MIIISYKELSEKVEELYKKHNFPGISSSSDVTGNLLGIISGWEQLGKPENAKELLNFYLHLVDNNPELREYEKGNGLPGRPSSPTEYVSSLKKEFE